MAEKRLKFEDFVHILQVFLIIFENYVKICKILKRILQKLHRNIEILRTEFPKTVF